MSTADSTTSIRCTINHVAIQVDDLEKACEFYSTLLDMTRLDTPSFSHPMAWLEFGDHQLHLIEKQTAYSRFQHFAVVVDDFEVVYERITSEEFELIDRDSTRLRAFPNGVVRAYLRDPSGNMLEILWPEMDSLPGRIQDEISMEEDNLELEESEDIALGANLTRYVDE